MALISVIIPVYNAEKYLKSCVASLFAQSFEDWEAILINDGSKDGSGQICDDYAQKDSRIRVIHQQNQGVSTARNCGIQYARGAYVMFLDADDQLDAQAFSELLPYMEKDFDVICWSLKTDDVSSPQYFTMSEDLTLAFPGDTDTLFDMRLRTFSGWSQDGKKDQCMPYVVTKLIKRNLILENRLEFDALLKHGEDTLFSIQVVEKAASVASLNRFFYIQTMHPGSATVSFCPTIGENNQRYLEALRNHIKEYHPNDERYQVALAKFQLSSFLLHVKLDCMHPEASYSDRIRKQKIRDACTSAVYLPEVHFWHRGYKWKHKAVHLAIQFRFIWLIQLAVKRGMI